MSAIQRWLAAAVCFGLATQSLVANAPARPMTARPVLFSRYKNIKPQSVRLNDGRTVRIDKYGAASIIDAHGNIIGERVLPSSVVPDGNPASPGYRRKVQALQQFLAYFQGSSRELYAPNALLVVFKDGVGPSSDDVTIAAKTLRAMRTAKTMLQRQSSAPRYTNDASINGAFAALGVSRVNRMFAGFDRSRLSSMRNTAQSQVRQPLLNIGNAYRVQINSASITQAISALRNLNGIAYAGPDWRISPMHTQPVPMSDAEVQQLRAVNLAKMRQASRLATDASVTSNAIPQNYGVLSSFQSMLNSSGLDAIAAYDEVENAFHQMPGTGEIITNVSIGDIYAAEDATGSTHDPCTVINNALGPMTQMVNGQRYLNMPGLPLIPAYAADAAGVIDPHYTACDEGAPDEYNLDFSMMAPLPDSAQRPGEQATPYIGDLLGIAPGASYRLVVPSTNGRDQGDTFESSIAGALLAAASQTPKPDVITASLGYGFDSETFPGRYLEDDPVLESLISTIVNAQNIVVCISANDGMRSYLPVSLGMYGGSAPTNVTTDSTQITQLYDVALSTVPSVILDSGAIDVGGTTLNDIFSRPPQDPQNASYANALAFPETRYNGGEDLSSGFGSRVNISAPADNVVALFRHLYYCPTPDCFGAVSTGGTSASAPEVAAAAAIALQIKRLTGHPVSSARAVRDLLVQTATPVAQPQQADVPLNVGPQLNVRHLVERLLSDAGMTVAPAVKRVAISQRRPEMPLDFENTIYFTNTDPGYINLAGVDYGLGPDGSGANAFLTLAPDWEGIPSTASYSLFVQGHSDRVLATTPFTRILPAAILNAAFPGQPLASNGLRTVHLTYRASSGKHMLAQTNFDLTFGPTDGTSDVGLAPVVPGVVKGTSFQVNYDVTAVRHMDNPMLVVTEPGRFTSANQFILHLVYSQPLAAKSGTITVPVSALQGAGLYGVAVVSTDPSNGTQYATNWATTRVEQGSTLRPPAPVAKVHGDIGGSYHFLEIGMNSSIDVTWDVSSVTGSSGALLETSAPGPTQAFLMSTFNNQNGSIPDNDGFNTGSAKVIPLPGVRGTATFTAAQLGLQNGMLQQIRVIPVSGTSATGEASDVSTIATDGILNGIDGLLLSRDSLFQGGFAINPNGNDGMLFPWRGVGGGYWSEAEVFDQKTHAIAPLELANVTDYGVAAFGSFYAPGGGMFNDTALFGVSQNMVTQAGSLYQMFPSVGTYQPDGTYQTLPNLSFPNPNYAVYQASSSNGSGKAALLVYDVTQNVATAQPMLMSVDVSSGSPVFTGPFPTNASLDILGSVMLFDADTNLGKALIVRQTPVDWMGAWSQVSMDVIDMNTGATTTVASQASGVGPGLAIDDSTHVAMMFSTGDNMMLTYNLQTGAQQKSPLPFTSQLPPWWDGLNALTPLYIAADPVNHLFLLAAAWDTGLLTVDYNETNLVYVVDENGNLVSTVKGLSMTGMLPTQNMHVGLQVNGHTRTGYLESYNQLQVFNY